MSARHEIVAAARRMSDLGLVTHTVGNVSARFGVGMLITPSRVHPYDLDPVEIVELSLDGCGTGTPSLEWPLHAAIYRARPDVRAIVHTHSPYATARSFDLAPLAVETEERVYLGIDRIVVAAPAPVGSEELGSRAVQALGPRSAALLARHGVVGVGSDPAEALEVCCLVEHQALIADVITRREPSSPPSQLARMSALAPAERRPGPASRLQVLGLALVFLALAGVVGLLLVYASPGLLGGSLGVG